MKIFMKFNFYVYILISIVVLMMLFIMIVPNMARNDGHFLTKIGEYNNYDYSYGYANNGGVYRRMAKGGELEKISTYVPLTKDSFFFNNGYAIFTSNGKKLVKIDLTTLKEETWKPDGTSPDVIGTNKDYIAIIDYKNNSYIKILSFSNFKEVISFDLNPQKYTMTDEFFEFQDYNTSKWYRYWFDTTNLEYLEGKIN